MDRPGIVYNDADGNATYLPLEQVRVKAVIVDVCARVSLIQTYGNLGGTTTGRCKYRFPMPANSAMCAFSMRTSDGRTVTGVSKAKDQAAEEFEEAVKAGKLAGLVEYVANDVFTISIGCISSQTTAEVKLVYVMTLANDDNMDEVRFQIPMAIGERYGKLPLQLRSTQAPTANTRIKFKIHIQTSGRIQRINSPSHPNDISEKKYLTDIGRPSRRRSVIRFQPDSYLDRDFVLVIHADGLDSPRCFAELYQDPNCREPDTIAMQLTIIPKFGLAPISSQEYIFVVDRSGSMAGERINMAKQTLNILLRMLPAQGTIFNIFSFGSHADGLWTQSDTYNQKYLSIATKHIDSMGADYGGTEIRNALEYAIASRSASMPSAIFILTDGEAHDVDETCRIVQLAVQGAPTQAPMRVYTLGIGNTVSSAMCEGIALAGNGVSLFAVDSESILGKCARLFRAGRTPIVKNVTVDWGVPREHFSQPPTVNFVHHPTSEGVTKLPSLPALQQVPTNITDIHAGHRMNISAILSLRNLRVPKAVTLNGELDGGGSFNMTVPIMAIQLRDAESKLPWVHTLVAWRLIQEHETNKAPLPQAATFMSNNDIRKAVIILLGEKYQLTSHFTSFIAIDEGQDDSKRSQDITLDSPLPSRSSSPPTEPKEGPGAYTSLGSIVHDLHATLRSAFQNLFTGVFNLGLNNRDPRLGTSRAWLQSPSNSHTSIVNRGDSDDESTRTFSTLSSLEGSDGWSNWSPQVSPYLGPQMVPNDPELMPVPSPRLASVDLAPEDVRLLLPRQPIPVVPPPLLSPPIMPEIVTLIQFQSFDGSFMLKELRGIVGNIAVDECKKLNVDDKVWATALSIAFIRKQMGHQKELSGDLTIKAMEFLEKSISDLDMKDIISRAEDVLS